MNKGRIEQWLLTDQLRPRSLDKEKVKSMIEVAKMNMQVVKTIPLTMESTILIFRETYESIRQLGDANWWVLGYEPRSHDVSLESLKEITLKNGLLLNHLDRFRRIRNDLNYRGIKASIAQTQEIISFWDLCAEEIMGYVSSALK